MSPAETTTLSLRLRAAVVAAAEPAAAAPDRPRRRAPPEPARRAAAAVAARLERLVARVRVARQVPPRATRARMPRPMLPPTAAAAPTVDPITDPTIIQ